MLTRVLTGAVASLLFIPICIFSEYVVFPIVIGILCFIGVYEMAKCLGFDKNYTITVPMYILAAGLPIFRFFTPKIFNGGANTSFLACCMVLLFGMLIYVLAYVMFKKNTISLSSILTFFAMFVYIVGCFSAIVVVRYSYQGNFMYILVFLGAWICDTFAYFTGRLLGKHKLIPEISPKKTVEGAIGGVVFDMGAFALYGLILRSFFNFEIAYVYLVIMGAVVAVVSQIGDLLASAIKRQYDVKDYGFIFPGHGGVLDRFDSVMLVSPFLYILISILNVI